MNAGGSDRGTTVISANTVVADTVLRPGWVELRADRILAVGAGSPVRPAEVALGPLVVVPGFVDIHCHGGGGSTFGGTAALSESAITMHRSHGTTSLLASLVSSDAVTLLDELEATAELVRDGQLAGLHLEGPWLSERRAGAHRREVLRDPTPAEVDRVLAAGRGTIRMITIAPERTGALDAIARLAARGVVPAIGHTDATFDQTRHAIDAGARVATHLFNAMPTIHHRRPGPVTALLGDPRVTLEIILDGVHLHPAVYRTLLAEHASRVALVTDAMGAAGLGDGRYSLGGQAVEVVDAVARLVGAKTIAGSTTTMDRVFAAAVRWGGADADTALLRAVHQTSTRPAAAVGLPDVGRLRAGWFADLVALDAAGDVAHVFRRGRRLPA